MTVKSKKTWSGSRIFRWSRKKYVQLFRRGLLGNDKVELIGGIIETISPQMLPHGVAISMTVKALEKAFGPSFLVLSQTTLNLGPGCMPDPDVFVISALGTQTPKIYAENAHLVVEVSETTLNRDRIRKRSMYAKFSVVDFWIVNLVETHLEVYRNPTSDSSQDFRFRYSPPVILKPGQTVSPLAKPNAVIQVADLFPS